MTWTLLNAEPAYGICDQCRKDSCGFVDGKHMWIDTGITDRSGDSIVIGYGCVKSWADNLGITKEVVEREVLRPPTEDELDEAVIGALGLTDAVKEAAHRLAEELRNAGEKHGVHDEFDSNSDVDSDLAEGHDKSPTRQPSSQRTRARRTHE